MDLTGGGHISTLEDPFEMTWALETNLCFSRKVRSQKKCQILMADMALNKRVFCKRIACFLKIPIDFC